MKVIVMHSQFVAQHCSLLSSLTPPPLPPQALMGMKELSRWRPTDDLMLISAIQQTNDLTAVHLGVNFSTRFSMQDVEERWHALLYNPQISQLAITAMQGLHPGVVTMALNNALWSQEEEAVLARIPPVRVWRVGEEGGWERERGGGGGEREG